MAKKKERTKAELIKRLSEVRIVEIACKSVGISRSTYYRWQQEDYDFEVACEEAIKQGTETISDLAESQVVAKIKSGDFKASIYWLEHHHKDYKKPPKKPEPKEEKDLFAKLEPEQLYKLIDDAVGAMSYESKEHGNKSKTI